MNDLLIRNLEESGSDIFWKHKGIDLLKAISPTDIDIRSPTLFDDLKAHKDQPEIGALLSQLPGWGSEEDVAARYVGYFSLEARSVAIETFGPLQ